MKRQKCFNTAALIGTNPVLLGTKNMAVTTWMGKSSNQRALSPISALNDSSDQTYQIIGMDYEGNRPMRYSITTQINLRAACFLQNSQTSVCRILLFLIGGSIVWAICCKQSINILTTWLQHKQHNSRASNLAWLSAETTLKLNDNSHIWFGLNLTKQKMQ